MRKYFLIVFLFLLFLACNSKEKSENIISEIDTTFEQEIGVHTFDEFKNHLNVDLNWMTPMGTYFWDEFGDYENQYSLRKDESKLLGQWKNITFIEGPTYVYYTFFPNKLLILNFNSENFRVIDAEKMYFNKALGTWEIIDGTVRITIYTIITEDKTMRHPNNKGVFFVERPYSIDFVNIDDIDERGFTRRPINDTILSEELQQKVNIRWLNTTNNLYIRTVYSIDFVTSSGKPEKNYGYFSIVPELAHENISGLELATNPELIRKYIPDWWY